MGAIEIYYPIGALEFASKQIVFLMEEARSTHIIEYRSLSDEISKLPGLSESHQMLESAVSGACNQWDVHVQEFYNTYNGFGNAISQGSKDMQQTDRSVANDFNQMHSGLA